MSSSILVILLILLVILLLTLAKTNAITILTEYVAVKHLLCSARELKSDKNLPVYAYEFENDQLARSCA